MSEESRISRAHPTQDERQIDLVTLTAGIVSAYVLNNRVLPSEVAALLSSVHAAVVGLSDAPAAVEAGPEKPTASQIRKSIKPDALISFIDGKSYKTLTRHLAKNDLTIDTYRDRYGLPRDYPSTAARYSEFRSAMAKSFGLGLRRNAEPAE